MSVNTIWTSLKEIYPEYIILVKLGKFYSVYNKDAYINIFVSRLSFERENILVLFLGNEKSLPF